MRKTDCLKNATQRWVDHVEKTWDMSSEGLGTSLGKLVCFVAFNALCPLSKGVTFLEEGASYLIVSVGQHTNSIEADLLGSRAERLDMN